MEDTKLEVSRRALLKSGAVGGVTLGTISSVASDRAEGVEIDSCSTITEPGTYELTADVSASRFDCIQIRSDDVVLDGNGYELALEESARARFEAMGIPSRGNRLYGTGVGASGGIENVTVRNLTVSTWDTGVWFEDVTDGSIDTVTATGNADGIAVDDSTGTTVSGSVATKNVAEGIVFYSTNESTVVESVADGNSRAGIALIDSARNTVRDVAVAGNGGDGLVLEGADHNDLSALTASEDTAGVTLVHSRGNRVSDVGIDRSGFAGIALGYAPENELTGVTVSDTGGDVRLEEAPSAIWLYAATGNRFEEIRSVRNDVWTIYARDESVANRFEDVTIDGGQPFSITVSDEAVDRHGNVSPVLGEDDGSVPLSVSTRRSLEGTDRETLSAPRQRGNVNQNGGRGFSHSEASRSV
ncbi:NosD domain-containing protein [Natrarchaeobius chitinivorans]|uniref:Periplasmic copper-binding protein NosD beta helix domain-containing protein n=1 Tax=Natrarchaeobius chitinivorans TaxID=1679083 RepID=A0A3N6LUT6_NATCH|nr:NosD domain-containing protein [Natrarchaeobius chitinivorans]RQG94088.1 hypothetical protein EA473_13565 [Natrarchaeobius chitinivorans]